MKVVCVDRGDLYLTVGKVYDVIGSRSVDFSKNQHIRLINDYGFESEYDESRFVNLSYIRDVKLTELGI